jgi:excisionase family DNA binding protein
VSRYTQIKLDYLRRHRLDLLAAVQADSMSIDRAYCIARGKGSEMRVEALRRRWERLTDAERRQFVRALPDSHRVLLLHACQAIEAGEDKEQAMEHHSPTCTADPTRVGPLYTPTEVAQLLCVSTRTVRDWVRNGMLTGVRYGKLLRIRQADLVAFGEVVPKRTPPEAEAE